MTATIAGVERLRLKFPGSKAMTFKDLSLRIEKGQEVLLLGPSGCGKSTLLQVLTGIIPNSIEVPLKADRIGIPSSWGYVFQDPDTQFCMPYVDEELAFVLENMQVPRERMQDRMSDLLAQVGLQFDDLHVPIQTLSQGMKQRLAIASVLALEPEALFLDEPTALLDPQGTKQVWDTLKMVAGDKTVVIVEHKIDEVFDFVDRVLLFSDSGELLADESPEGLFTRHKHLLEQFGIWYPGVWEDYIRSERFRGVRNAERKDASYVAPVAAHCSEPLLRLCSFNGYHGNQLKLTVESAHVEAGEWIAIVGENGAGKSTLLQSLMQLIRTDGSYILNGRDVRRFEEVAGKLSYIFQNPEFQFVTNSVYEEIAVTLRLSGDFQEAAAKELLDRFGLIGHEHQHPYQLSLGQKRRLSVATALAQAQQALLLDEPTFGQDARNTFTLLEKLEQCRRQGISILMVTHDLDIVEHFASRVWVIADGKLARDLEPASYLNGLSGTGEKWIREVEGESRHAAIYT